MMLVILFLVLIVCLKIFFFRNLTLDTIVLTTAIVALVLFALYNPKRETFSQPNTVDLNKIKFLNNLLIPTDKNNTNSKTGATLSPEVNQGINEDITPISKNLQMYLSTYSAKSYNGSGTLWYNIAPGSGGSPERTCTPQGNLITRDISFTSSPTYEVERGLFLGKNKGNGPMSWTLGIDGSSLFTIFLLCQHDTLPTSNRINLMKLYGNSSNNNGLSLDISKVSTQKNAHENTKENLQVGNFSVSFADAVYDSSVLVPLDTDKLYLYVITKTASKLIVTAFSSTNSDPVRILNAPLSTTDVLFSNKNMCINSTENWNGYVKAFGAYNIVLDDMGMNTLYKYLMLEEKKQEDLYQQYQEQITTMNQEITTMKACPLDSATCKTCGSVADWSKVENVLSADKQCRGAVDAYCTKNKKDDFCACWDKTSSLYNSPQCQNWRNIFKDIVPTNLGQLSPEDIEKLKKMYGLIEASKCQQVPKKVPVVSQGSGTCNLTNEVALEIPIIEPKKQSSTCPSTKKSPTEGPVHVYIEEPQKPTFKNFWSWLGSWF
jgi:hypothetical protein